MTTFITTAARAYLDAAEQGIIPGDKLELENDQLAALLEELTSLRTADDNKHARAERGRIAVELFGFNDDIETVASDVIADILHWVGLNSSPDHVAPAVFRAIGYYLEERNS
jgi:hypothetical protein